MFTSTQVTALSNTLRPESARESATFSFSTPLPCISCILSSVRWEQVPFPESSRLTAAGTCRKMLLSCWSARFGPGWPFQVGCPRSRSCIFSLALRAFILGGTRSATVKKLYVGNLSFKATEEQVQALFAEVGVQPDALSLLRDRFTGQPRGFGFAEVHDDAEAEKAIAALNGKEFLGRALVVNEARPQREGGGAGGGHGGRSWWRRRWYGGGGGGGRGGHGGGGGYGGGGGGGGDRRDR